MRTFNSITAMMASMLMLSLAVSCREEAPEPAKIELSASEVTLTKTGKSQNEGSAAVVVSSNVYWRAFVQEGCDWLSLSRAGGPDGRTELLLTAEGNFDGQRREVKVVFEPLEGASAVLTVRQMGSDDALDIIADDFGGNRDSDVVFAHGVGTATGLSYATFVYDGSGCYISSDQPSSGYEEASGEGNLLIPAGSQMTLCKLDYHLAEQYTLNFGVWGGTAEAVRSFSILVSSDATSWETLPFSTDFEKDGWKSARAFFDFAESGSVGLGWIRFVNNSDADIRVDDILMTESSFGPDDYKKMDITGRTWADGASVSVFDGLFKHTFRYVSGTFQTLDDLASSSVVALSPADPQSYLADGAVHTSFPAVYEYDPSSEKPVAPMVGSGNLSSVALQPVCGTIKVKFLKMNALLAGVRAEVLEGPAVSGECSVDSRSLATSFSENAGTLVSVNLTREIDMSVGDNNFVEIPLPAATYPSLLLTAIDNQGTETELSLSNVAIAAGEAYEVSMKCEDATIINLNMPSYYGETGTDKVYSNCYRISEPGEYKFECCRPDGTAVSGADGTWVWATSGIWTSKAEADCESIISDLSYDGKYFYFTVGEESVYGNVMVAVVDSDGYILYSWHIWTTSAPVDVSFGGFMWMDRNIGASYCFDPSDREICQAARGFYFSWGSRVPTVGSFDWSTKTAFEEGKSATFYCSNLEVKNAGTWGVIDSFPSWWTGTNDDVAKYPMSVIPDNTRFCNVGGNVTWTPENDPCPYGYHVMTFEEASELGKVTLAVVKDTEGTLVNVASQFTGSGSDALILPSCGYRNNNSGAVIAYAGNPDGRYWTSETLSTNVAYGRYWLMNASNNKTNQAGKNIGMSVRCVRNHN